MFRAALVFLAVLAGSAAGADAQTIVQTSTNQSNPAQGGLRGFDYSLGTLDRVTLFIQSNENRLAWGHVGLWPDGAPDVVDVTWTIDGLSGFQTFLAGGQRLAFDVPIYGTGTQQVVAPFERAVPMTATGSAAFEIDPTLIPQQVGFSYDFAVTFFGPGFYDGSDVQFVTSYPLNPQALGFECPFGQGEESCNFFSYTLTYFYTPANAVPEPATWAMMLLGFGAAGLALRRRQRKLVECATVGRWASFDRLLKAMVSGEPPRRTQAPQSSSSVTETRSAAEAQTRDRPKST